MRFRSIALALSLATAALHPGAVQAQVIELKLSHFVPPQHAFHKWITAWAENIEKQSNGRLKFTIYPNGQLVGPP
jgi:TRAP-type C4-dicarboxylate transport system substrate-binding protein